MRKLATTVAISLCLSAGTQVYACSLSPSYLEGEFGSDGIVLGDLFADANQVLIGRYTQPLLGNDLDVTVSKRLKPYPSTATNKYLSVRFLNVKRHKIYISKDTDDRAHSDTVAAAKFIRTLQPTTFAYQRKGTRFGFGGPLADIHHGTDCERGVVLHEKQDYLIAIDNKNVVLANLPISSSLFDDRQLIAGQSLKSVLGE